MRDLSLEAVSPSGEHVCCVSADAQSVWMYLHALPDRKILAEAPLGSRVLPITLAEFKRTYRGGSAPPLVREYSTERPLLTDLAGVTLRWAPDGVSVAAFLAEEPIAFVISGERRGYARVLRVEGPWGHPWDDEVFGRVFGLAPGKS